jgi:hypothetical protein
MGNSSSKNVASLDSMIVPSTTPGTLELITKNL